MSDMLEIIDRYVDEAVDEITAKEISEGRLKSFYTMSANLLRLRPDIPMDRHREIYHHLLKVKLLENTPQFLTGIDWNKACDTVEGGTDVLKRSAIYVSYHLGAYRSAIMLMVKHNVDIAVVVDSSVYDVESVRRVLNTNLDLAKQFFKESSTKMEIVDAEGVDTVVRLLGYLKKGYSLLTYVDWSSGMKNSGGDLVIPFMGERISVRQSLACLSYYARCPLVPLMSSLSRDHEIHWRLFDPIVPDGKTPMSDYSASAMTRIFGLLEERLSTEFDQWQGWLQVHKMLVLNDPPKRSESDSVGGEYRLSAYAGLFVVGDSFFVMDRKTYKVIRIDKGWYDLLVSSGGKPFGIPFPKEEAQALRRCGILI